MQYGAGDQQIAGAALDGSKAEQAADLRAQTATEGLEEIIISTGDLGASWNAGNRRSIQLSVNNVFNEVGVSGAYGDMNRGYDVQALSAKIAADPNQTLIAYYNEPRAYSWRSVIGFELPPHSRLRHNALL